jgi:hypothetical protein
MLRIGEVRGTMETTLVDCLWCLKRGELQLKSGLKIVDGCSAGSCRCGKMWRLGCMKLCLDTCSELNPA